MTWDDTAHDLLTRFDVALAIGQWPPDLVREVRRALAESGPYSERKARRDFHLRRAAAYLSGSPWTRAVTLSRILRRWNGSREGPIRAALGAALDAGAPLPGLRQLARILTDEADIPS